ncbi:hypothetical protein CMQ_4831 [Grosmannia clavigera kw1407]|uniref:Uncharacterized protein n=1 Tax=Grosmannia clavigera (strain kw1407 / UAMH 11150) TaxID=655863 RepID=F0XTG4_GROCL|nr:uncharacterized protein CMQ_4831 [Grosmannia clavigera kw1407]EFW98979.1 hypothetical protein CMQ_4831 [Grosmannia clavigera kw1407]
MASAATEKTSKWDAEAHMALCTALTKALLDGGDSLARHSDVLMTSMKASGQDFTWEAIRQVFAVFVVFASVLPRALVLFDLSIAPLLYACLLSPFSHFSLALYNIDNCPSRLPASEPFLI